MIDKEKYGETMDNDPLQIYVDEGLRNFAAANLVLMAYESYHYSYLYQNIDMYRAFQKLPIQEKMKSEVILPVVVPYLNCCYTICTVFENFMKAHLLRHNIVVHTFKTKEQYNLQKTHPYQLDQPNIQKVKEILNEKHTIGFKRLMTPHYQSSIKLPKSMFEYLEYIVEFRNTLHFQTAIKYSSSDKILLGLEEVHKFITIDIGAMLTRMGMNSSE